MIAALLLLALEAAGTATATTEEEEEAARTCTALLDDPGAAFAARRLFILQRLRDWLPPGTPEACVDRLLAAPGVPPDLLRQAAALRATWAWEQGDDARAAAEAARAGAVAGWQVAGPFVDPRRSPLSGGGTVADAVATLRAGSASPLPGRDGPVQFHDLPATRADGVIDLPRAVPLTEGACALLRATLPASRRPARLFLGGAPELSVWLAPLEPSSAAEPLVVPAAREGLAPVRVAVPLPRGAGAIDVYLGVCPESAAAEVRAFTGAGTAEPERALERVTGEVRGAAARASLLDAAELLVEAGVLPSASDPLAEALGGVPVEDAGRAALLRARSGVTGADRYAAAAEALLLRPDDLDALLAVIGEGSALPGRPGVREAADRAAQLAPTSVRVVVAGAREWLAAELPLQAGLMLEPLDVPDAPAAVLRALDSVAAALRRTTERAELARRVLLVRVRDEAAWSVRIDAAIDAGSYDEVRGWLASGPFGTDGAATAGSLGLDRLAARTLLRLGDVEPAIARYERLARERPADETAWFDLGWALARAGREDEAERALRRGLVLRPTDGLARSWIAAREVPDPRVRRWLEPGEDLARLLDATRAAFPGADAAYLFRAAVVTMDAGGGVRELQRRIFAVLTLSGAEDADRLPLASFDPGRTVFRVTRMSVSGPDGRTRGGATVGMSGGDVPDARLFTPLRFAAVELPRLEPGDLVDLEFELIDVGPSSLPEDALAREFPLRDVVPTGRLRVVAAVPTGLVPRIDAPASASARRESETGVERTFASWEADGIAAVPREPFAPPLRELSGVVRVTTFASWDEVGGWIAGLFRPAGPDRRVAALGEGKDVAAIYREVASSVRYVAAEYGSHGLQPAPPAVTLARGYGDCKDKAALLIAALAAAGIEAHPTLVRSRYAGIDPSAEGFAFPYAFDHVVVYLPPPYGRYVDPTATRLPWDVLPRSDRGAFGLVLGPDGPEPVVLPDDVPEGEGVERRDMLFFDPTGEAALVGTLYASGAEAADLRELLAPPDLRAGIVALLVDRDLTDTHVMAADLEGLDPDAAQLRIDYVGSVPGFGVSTGDGLEVPLGVRFDLVERFASSERRESDVELSAAGFPVHWRRDVQIGLTGNWVWDRLPADARLTEEFGTFSLAVRVEGGMLHVAVDLTIPRLRIVVREFGAFRAFLERVDGVLAQHATAVRREPGE
jgi:tetratricopeptide (TPR) repeat protein